MQSLLVALALLTLLIPRGTLGTLCYCGFTANIAFAAYPYSDIQLRFLFRFACAVVFPSLLHNDSTLLALISFVRLK